MTIDWLPHETLKLIFRFLPAKSLISSEMVCSLWRDASKDNTYWKELCRKQLGVCPDQFVPPPDPVKLLYQLTYGSLVDIKYNGSGGQGSNLANKVMRFL